MFGMLLFSVKGLLFVVVKVCFDVRVNLRRLADLIADHFRDVSLHIFD